MTSVSAGSLGGRSAPCRTRRGRGKVSRMAHAAPRADTERDSRRPVRMGLAVVGAVLIIAFAVALYGGYGPDDWGWTGFEHAQLWDWLHVLLLPIAFGGVAIL